VKIDPLHQAVDTLSDLLKKLWALRQQGEFDTPQTRAINRLVDETLVSIISLIRKVRKVGSRQSGISTSSSAAVKRAFVSL
jgi:hypothetical protein